MPLIGVDHRVDPAQDDFDLQALTGQLPDEYFGGPEPLHPVREAGPVAAGPASTHQE